MNSWLILLVLVSIASVLIVSTFRMFQRYEKMKIVAGIILSCTLPVAYLLSMISGLEFAKILGVLVTVVMILEVMAYMVVPMIKNR